MTPFFPDAQSHFGLQALLYLALPLTVWTLLVGRHDRLSLALWCLSGVMAGLGFAFIGLRGVVPDALGYSGGAVLTYGAGLLRGAALRRELARPSQWPWLLLIGIVAVAGFHVCWALGADARELYAAAIRVAGAAWLASLGFQLAGREHTRSARLLGGVYLLGTLAATARVIVVLRGWGDGHVPTAWDYAPFHAVTLLIALYANLGYVGLVWERSRARERAQDQALAEERARQAQAESHARWLDTLRAQRREVLNEATPAMLHSIDPLGRLVAVSDTWLSKLGYTRTEVIGRPSSDFLTEASRAHAREVVLPAFFRTGRCDHIAYDMVRKDGSVMAVRLSGVLERDERGQPSSSIAVIEDLTEAVAREAELAREHALRLQVERHARELDALAAERSDMLYVLAHEVRQPLNNASAALQSAAAVLAQSQEAEASDRLGRAQAVLGNVLSGLDNTLAVAALLARTDPVPTQDEDIDTLLAIVLVDIGPNRRPRVRIERATTTRTAAMDLGLVRLALRNLLDNALSYSPAGAPVVLRVVDSDEPLALLLEVMDAGPGIEPALMPRLFERGARGERGQDTPGSGLGLYIVRRVMELHGGQVEAVRGREGGMTLRLWLPQGLQAWEDRPARTLNDPVTSLAV